jgi:diacylglycerol kinase family enzyme
MDAVIMRDAPEAVKSSVGWPAYVLSALKHLRRPGTQLQVVIDGGRPYRTRAQTVIVGNMGRLQGGVQLLQAAVPDDGLLDIAVVSSRGLADLGRIVSRVLTHREHTDHRFVTLQGKHIEITLRHAQPRQVDGDLLDPSRRLEIEVEPAAVVVRVPRPAAAQ